MKTFKKILWALLFPHIAVLIFLTPTAAGLLIYSFVVLGGEGMLCYVSYALSAYTLTALCCQTPRIIRGIREIKEENQYVHRLVTDAPLRVKLSLYGSLCYNTAYGVFQLGLGFWHRSVWYYALAGYYVLLAVMRFYLLRYTRTHEPGADMAVELRRYRFCGVALLLMNLALAVIVLYMTFQIRVIEHHEITTIAMAAYTFGALTMAIRNVFKYRKYNSPVFSAAKAVSLASALVSMLTLESAMLNAFGEAGQEAFSTLMTGLTGIGVTLLILAMAVYMIRRANFALGELKNNKTKT